jgi:chaperonin cofactor prefoldin
MTIVAKLLARKQQLLERLQEAPGPHERDKIERLLSEIDTALNLLEEAGPEEASDEE